MYSGIDVSKHNGSINWRAVKNSGVDFVIIRTGYGKVDNAKQRDQMFNANYSGAKAVGIPVGAYHYSYAKSVAEAVQEAEFMLRVLDGKQFEYPIYFDIEDKSQEALGKQLLTDMCIAFCERIESAGYYAGIYANVDWFTNKLDQKRLEAYDKWLAHWVKSPKWGAEFCGLWQYSATGKIDGIKGNVDLNKSYRNYPAIIKKAGLNGFNKSKVKYSVTARMANLDKAVADKVAGSCIDLGMSVVVSEEG